MDENRPTQYLDISEKCRQADFTSSQWRGNRSLVQNQLLPSHKKKETLSFVTASVHLESVMLREINKIERQVLFITYIWNVKKKKAKLVKTESRLVVTRSWGMEELEKYSKV